MAAISAGVWWAVAAGLPAGISALFTAGQPLLTALLAAPLLGERSRRGGGSASWRLRRHRAGAGAAARGVDVGALGDVALPIIANAGATFR